LQQAARQADPAGTDHAGATGGGQSPVQEDRLRGRCGVAGRHRARQPGRRAPVPEQPQAENDRADVNQRPERAQPRRRDAERRQAADPGRHDRAAGRIAEHAPPCKAAAFATELPWRPGAATAANAAPHIAAQCGAPATPISNAEATSAPSIVVASRSADEPVADRLVR
jgi:hypothetical protein